jgi:hypothetical protein
VQESDLSLDVAVQQNNNDAKQEFANKETQFPIHHGGFVILVNLPEATP